MNDAHHVRETHRLPTLKAMLMPHNSQDARTSAHSHGRLPRKGLASTTAPSPAQALNTLPKGLQLILEPEYLDPRRRAVLACAVVGSWYASNISVLLLNKWLLSTSFHNPVFLTLCHMLACFTLGVVASLLKLTPLRPLRSRHHLVRVCTLAALFCSTVVLGNLSLKYISLSFNQMLGASTPLFTALFAAILIQKRERMQTYAALLPVTFGIVLASGFEPSFDAFGWAMCMTSTAGRALNSVVQAMLLSDSATDHHHHHDSTNNNKASGAKLDAMSLLLYMSGVSVLL